MDKVLNKFELSPFGGKSYTEEELFKEFISNPEDKHQFIAVYGQSGTGKSHLIRWFEARYEQNKPKDEVILFIRRSDNTLKGTIRQLLEKPEVQDISNKEVYERLVKASLSVEENKLKDMIYHNFIIESNNDSDEQEIKLTTVRKKRLIAFLNNEVVHDYLMSSNGPVERMYSKIAEHTLVDRDTVAQFEANDFIVSPELYDNMTNAGADSKAERMARELMSDEKGPIEAQKIANYLNQFVCAVIQRCAGIEPGDFKQIFLDIRKELYRLDKKLTLFIEDITSFTGVDTALLDALLEEHTGKRDGENICRISSIVGTTNNYLQNNFKDNHKERISKYIYIPSDVLDEEGLYEFVARYINTMSLDEESIADWVNGHANPEDYPVHDLVEGKNWEYVNVGYNKEISIYPFTKRSILYFYNYVLQKGHQTPRYIIRDIIEPVVRDAIFNKDSLTDYVPYRLIKPFVEKEGKDYIDRKNYGRFIAYLNAFTKVNHEFFYDIADAENPLKRRIRLNEEWVNFIVQNYAVIMGWLRFNKALFIQDRNPGVPGVMYKVAPETEEKHKSLKKARKLWIATVDVTGNPLYEIYTGNELSIEEFDLDHFVPRSYVSNDELWNLTPMAKKLNSSKNNKLPAKGYIKNFVEYNYYLYSLIFDNGNKDQAAILKHCFDQCENQHLNAVWATEKLYIPGNSKEQFENILEENLSLVYDSAKLQEYEMWVI